MTGIITDSSASGSRPLVGGAEVALERATWQPVIFAAQPRRAELLRLRAAWPCREVSVQVHRNHAFEHVASAMAPFQAFARMAPAFRYGDYDDSLAMDAPERADVEIVWLDYERYEGRMEAEALADWLVGRVRARRARTDAPILVTNWPSEEAPAAAFNARLQAALPAVAGASVCDLMPVRSILGERVYDRRAMRLSGTPFSDAACVAIAGQFGLAWLPAAANVLIKAIVIDLDHTLYSGVLGEDGPRGVVLTPGHAALQRRLVELREQGIFLAVASRNEAADVRELFATRTDFPLRPEHLSACEVNWGHKAESIERAVAQLRVGYDAVLFLDDNPGELAAVAHALPGLWTLHAREDAAETMRALDLHPGLFRRGTSETDALRANDLAANAEREALAAQAADPIQYLASLQASLTFALDPRAQLERLQELPAKTNQFNLALARLSAAEVARRLDDPESPIVSIRLADRLADSGIVGAAYGHREGDTLVVDELCVSCRALGRRLEDVMIGEAVDLMLAAVPARRVAFRYVHGPRNAPAREWLERFTGRTLPADAGELVLDWSVEEHRARAKALPVTLVREGADGA